MNLLNARMRFSMLSCAELSEIYWKTSNHDTLLALEKKLAKKPSLANRRCLTPVTREPGANPLAMVTWWGIQTCRADDATARDDSLPSTVDQMERCLNLFRVFVQAGANPSLEHEGGGSSLELLQNYMAGNNFVLKAIEVLHEEVSKRCQSVATSARPSIIESCRSRTLETLLASTKWTAQQCKALLGKTFPRRLKLGWVSWQALTIGYILDGHAAHMVRLERRLAHDVSRVREGSDFCYVYLCGMRLAMGMDDEIVEVSGENRADAIKRLERCYELVSLYLRNGLDPYQGREFWGGRNVEQWWHSDRDVDFYIETSRLFAENKAIQRGAHLDAVLPPVIVPEGAPAHERARL